MDYTNEIDQRFDANSIASAPAEVAPPEFKPVVICQSVQDAHAEFYANEKPGPIKVIAQPSALDELASTARGWAKAGTPTQSGATWWFIEQAIYAANDMQGLASVWAYAQPLMPQLTDTTQRTLTSIATRKLATLEREAQRSKAVMVKPKPKGESYGGIDI